jgi:hypothetical protein
VRNFDPAFKYWGDENRRALNIYESVAALFNFKVLRGLYSKAFKEKNEFSAPFTEEYENIIKPLFIGTLFNVVLQVVPVLIVDIYTVVFIPWGY